MQNELLVAAILEAVVRAVGVPVTLKTRLGWHDEHQNLPTIAKIAEESGIAALAIHGRTRTQMYKGEARYELIAETKGRLNIPRLGQRRHHFAAKSRRRPQTNLRRRHHDRARRTRQAVALPRFKTLRRTRRFAACLELGRVQCHHFEPYPRHARVLW